MARQPIWLRPVVESTTGRPAEWSREQITSAGVAVAEADGLAAVTMRRVAAELGTGAASLYRHVETRDDLVDLMVDRAFSEMELFEPSGDWRADLVDECMSRLAYLRRRSWLVDAIVARPPIGPGSLRILEATLALLEPCPAPGSAKMETIGVMLGMIQTTAVHESPGRMLDQEFVAAQMSVLVAAASDGRHPHIAEIVANPPERTESDDERLARILRVVVDGLLPDDG